MEIKNFLISHLTEEQKEQPFSFDELTLKEIIEASTSINYVLRHNVLNYSDNSIPEDVLVCLANIQCSFENVIESELGKLAIKK